MSKSSRRHASERYGFADNAKLWHSGAHLTTCLGCQGCYYSDACGGLNVEAGIYDCLTFCRCTDPAKCDNVCPRNAAHQVARIHEIGGFELETVPSAPAVPDRVLPRVVSMIYHSAARSRPPLADVVALSLYEFVSKLDGSLRFATRRHMLEHFKLGEATRIVLSGTDHDPTIERWWRLENREEITRGLMGLGIELITTPNYSLFGDVPRLDNLFNMKRIATVWSEMQRAGMACALHLNARTDRDYERWTRFLIQHPEITYVSFEFGTGAGSGSRIAWHVAQLTKLAAAVARPIHLVVRGGISELRTLSETFSGITLIDTGVFMKTQHRQRAVLSGAQLIWERCPTPEGAPIDELFDMNIETLQKHVARVLTDRTSEASVRSAAKSA